MSDEDSSSDTEEFGDWLYFTKINVTVDRQRIEDGYSLNSWEDRLEGQIESETVFQAHQAVKAETLSESLPVVDTAQIDPISSGPHADVVQDALGDPVKDTDRSEGSP